MNKIKTVGLEHNIKVKTDMYCDKSKKSDPLPEVTISPSLKSQEVSGGLCGSWSSTSLSECNYYDKNKTCISLAETEKIVQYWKYVEERD